MKTKINESNEEEVLEYYQMGFSDKRISEKFDFSRRTVFNWRRDNKLIANHKCTFRDNLTDDTFSSSISRDKEMRERWRGEHPCQSKGDIIKRKSYLKNYRQINKLNIKEYKLKYRSSSNYKAKKKEYQQRPEVRLRQKEYYNENSKKIKKRSNDWYKENKEMILERNNNPEVKAKKKEYQQRPEVKAKKKEYDKERYRQTKRKDKQTKDTLSVKK